MTNDDRPEMKRVDISCGHCGADLPLYHDGISHTTCAITCACGKTIHWTFEPERKNSTYRGFGIIPSDSIIESVPGTIDVFTAPLLGVDFIEPWVVVTEDQP